MNKTDGEEFIMFLKDFMLEVGVIRDFNLFYFLSQHNAQYVVHELAWVFPDKSMLNDKEIAETIESFYSFDFENPKRVHWYKYLNKLKKR